MQNEPQKDSECANDFIYRFDKLAKLSELSDNSIISIFINNTTGYLKEALIRENPQTLRDAYERARINSEAQKCKPSQVDQEGINNRLEVILKLQKRDSVDGPGKKDIDVNSTSQYDAETLGVKCEPTADTGAQTMATVVDNAIMGMKMDSPAQNERKTKSGGKKFKCHRCNKKNHFAFECRTNIEDLPHVNGSRKLEKRKPTYAMYKRVNTRGLFADINRENLCPTDGIMVKRSSRAERTNSPNSCSGWLKSPHAANYKQPNESGYLQWRQ